MDGSRGSVVLCLKDLNSSSGGFSIRHLEVCAKVKSMDSVHILTKNPVHN